MGQNDSHLDYTRNQLMEFKKNEKDLIQHKGKIYSNVIDLKKESIRL